MISLAIPVQLRPGQCKSRLRGVLEACATAFGEFDDSEEWCVRALFERYPSNDDRWVVGTKVSVLNALFGTAIRDTKRLARHIQANARRLDTLVMSPDRDDRLAAIDIVAKGHGIRLKGQRRGWTLLSFASKYCHFQSPRHFPIYDSYAVLALTRVLKHVSPDLRVTQESLRDYRRLIQAEEALPRVLQWHSTGFRMTDRALWALGQSIYFAEHSKTKKQRKENEEMEYVRTSSLPGFLVRRAGLHVASAWSCAGHQVVS